MIGLSPLKRTKKQAQEYYDQISGLYDWITSSEEKFINQGIRMLSPQPGEKIIEIGSGTGRGLMRMCDEVTSCGRLVGLDLSHLMLMRIQKKYRHPHPPILVGQADGEHIPLEKNHFDGAFCAFTLELFPQEGIGAVLNEVKRVLKPSGRFAVVALAKSPDTLARRIYEFGHMLFPVVLDCRPIPLKQLLEKEGFLIKQQLTHLNWGLPITTILAAIAR